MNSARHLLMGVGVVGVIAAALTAQRRDWTEIGPKPISGRVYTGRVSAIAPSTKNANLYYVAGADGGVWKTTDGGTNWQPIGDFLPTTATGALCLDPSNDQVLWVGTGEANFAHHSRYGVGIAKTVDGGNNWVVYGEAAFGGRCISRIRIDPKNRSVLYATSTHAGGFLPPKTAARGHPGTNGPLGVWKSGDGGETWTQLTNGIPSNLSATDLVIDPVNPATLYAAYGDIFGDTRNGIYKTTDGGKTWSKQTSGLPSNPGRVSLSIAPSRAQRLYAIFVNRSSASSGGASTLGAYKTDNGGANWSRMSAAGNFQASYGWYLSVAVVHPSNPDITFLGGFSLRRSTNGGSSFSTRTPPHVDLHALEWDASGRLLCGNDGGLHRSGNNGDSWTALNQNLGMIQFYAGLSLHPTNATLMYGGFQDNGTCRRTSSTAWTSVSGGDGGCTGIDPTGVYAFCESQGTGNLYRSVNNGSFRRSSSGISGRNCFLPPFDIDKRNGTRMVYGTERVFLSTNNGSSWASISGDLTRGTPAAIHGIEIAPSDGNYIYVKTNDGRVQVTENGGGAWNLRRTGVPGWYRTTRPFAVHPTDPKKVYLAVAWFGVDQVLYSSDAGRTWTALDGDLPDVPVHSIGVDATQGVPPVLFAGTDQGVWRSVDHGGHWEIYGQGVPHVAVVDLRMDVARRRIVFATQGRGAWETALLPRGEKHGKAKK